MDASKKRGLLSDGKTILLEKKPSLDGGVDLLCMRENTGLYLVYKSVNPKNVPCLGANFDTIWEALGRFVS